ncbi:hypothetical protein WPS_19660 [Vulcanimicrobium alpinum]|uniref:Uncharacterized protein n=1 Tax=Vulcanimicrobium alpinum TaxID=3016050 RepID=A0AAN2C9M5_UNVUL|nr:hypothetical protein [Vulcanimicrobium alpinum]BDE06690.1 hypothetical protein WPS_19660 [Vulcanimicrobium alpinum]
MPPPPLRPGPVAAAPPPLPPSGSAQRPAAPQQPAPPRQPTPPAATPFGTPFALPDDEPPFGGAAAPEPPKSGFGWSWEPPDEPEQPEAR